MDGAPLTSLQAYQASNAAKLKLQALLPQFSRALTNGRTPEPEVVEAALRARREFRNANSQLAAALRREAIESSN